MDKEEFKKQNRYIYEKVSTYADEVLNGIDPQKTQISFQLEKLKPMMETLAIELETTVEDIFIRYMDHASVVSVGEEKKFQSTMGNMNSYGDYMEFEKF